MAIIKLESRRILIIKILFAVAFLLGVLAIIIADTCKNSEIRTVKKGSIRITENDKNPYSPETTRGFYLYDIFEANRGSYTGGDWFSDAAFNYYKEFNPLQDKNYYIKWNINLAKMKDYSPLANEFNNYHKLLLEQRKAEMVKLCEEGIAQYKKGISNDFGYYSRNICTEAYYFWDDLFMVIDVNDVHMSQKGGVSVTTANFNISSGKKYELADLFHIKDYKKRLLMEIAAQHQDENYIVNKWKDCLEQEKVSFLLAFKGLILIDNFEQSTFLIEWDRIEDVLRKK